MIKKIYNSSIPQDFIIDKDKESAVIENANILVLGGPGDVCPEIFEEKPWDKVLSSSLDTSTDIQLLEILKLGLNLDNIRFIICLERAAFIACALAGGNLLQNVDNHNDGKLKKTSINGKTYLLPSRHTQLMHPYNLPEEDYKVIAHSLEKSSRYYGKYAEKALNDENYKEAEYVLFKSFSKPILAITPNINTLRVNSRTLAVTNNIINKYFQ